MAKASPESVQSFLFPTVEISDDTSPEILQKLLLAFKSVGAFDDLPIYCHTKNFLSGIVADVLKPLEVTPGRLTCLLTVKPSITNYYSIALGGAIASIAEAVARTVVGGEGSDIFLGEQSISHVSAAHVNAEVIVDANVVKKGKNLTVVPVDFRLKKTLTLVYQSRVTFFDMPVSKL